MESKFVSGPERGGVSASPTQLSVFMEEFMGFNHPVGDGVYIFLLQHISFTFRLIQANTGEVFMPGGLPDKTGASLRSGCGESGSSIRVIQLVAAHCRFLRGFYDVMKQIFLQVEAENKMDCIFHILSFWSWTKKQYCLFQLQDDQMFIRF